MAGITDYSLISRSLIRTATFSEQYLEVQRLGVRQNVVDMATLLPAAGYLRLRIERDTNLNPKIGIQPFLAATAPASSSVSPRYDYSLVGSPVVSPDNLEISATYDLIDNAPPPGQSSPMKRIQVQAFIDAGSPVGYSWRIR